MRLFQVGEVGAKLESDLTKGCCYAFCIWGILDKKTSPPPLVAGEMFQQDISLGSARDSKSNVLSWPLLCCRCGDVVAPGLGVDDGVFEPSAGATVVNAGA